MHKYQKCLSERRTFEITVPSSSGDGKHVISGAFENGVIRCDCKGFHFNGTCKHTKFDTEECGWSGSESVEVQSLKQKNDHRCPRCGGRTVDVGCGKF